MCSVLVKVVLRGELGNGAAAGSWGCIISTSQQCFSLTSFQHQPPASQQYFSLTTISTSQPNEAIFVEGMSSSSVAIDNRQSLVIRSCLILFVVTAKNNFQR
jgi:hypothetical protein